MDTRTIRETFTARAVSALVFVLALSWAWQGPRALMAEITGGGHERLGDAVLAAQAAYAETGVMPELLSIYHLFAGPGMRIR